jgi:hypothetical protein
MNKAEIKTAVKKALKRGNWIIRADRDGISHGGFRWQPVGSGRKHRTGGRTGNVAADSTGRTAITAVISRRLG